MDGKRDHVLHDHPKLKTNFEEETEDSYTIRLKTSVQRKKITMEKILYQNLFNFNKKFIYNELAIS